MISFRKLSVERLLQGISMGHWKADSTVCDSGFGMVYVYNADEMQQLNRPPDPVFYLPYVLQ